jgi:hypothetical protein
MRRIGLFLLLALVAGPVFGQQRFVDLVGPVPVGEVKVGQVIDKP